VNSPRILWHKKKKKKNKKKCGKVSGSFVSLMFVMMGGTCHNEIGLCDHNIDTVMVLIVNTSEKVCVILFGDGKILFKKKTLITMASRL
jgi:hypothetical protein